MPLLVVWMAGSGDQLACILTMVEDSGVWPDGLLDACIAMILKSDGDASPLGQRALSVLPVVYRLDSIFSAGGGRGSVEALLLLLILRRFLRVVPTLMFTSLLLMLLSLLILLIWGFLIVC